MIVKYFEESGSTKHGRMPYYQALNKVLENDEVLQRWAQNSIAVAQKAK